MGMTRGQPVVFNFDSLTDCITNLAGSLILVTLIIFGLTQPKESGDPGPAYKPTNVGGPSSMASLVHKLEVMRTDLRQIHSDLEGYGEQLPEMISTLEKIEQRSKSR